MPPRNILNDNDIHLLKCTQYNGTCQVGYIIIKLEVKSN